MILFYHTSYILQQIVAHVFAPIATNIALTIAMGKTHSKMTQFMHDGTPIVHVGLEVTLYKISISIVCDPPLV
jgi:hypothetical protein